MGRSGTVEPPGELRGHLLRQAAKCLVVRVGTGRRSRRYVLAVVPGDRRVDMRRVRELYGGTDAAFAAREVAERLSGCVSGCVVPFTFHPDLDLVVDSGLLRHDDIYCNAARLDLSIALPVPAYVALARPRTAVPTTPAGPDRPLVGAVAVAAGPAPVSGSGTGSGSGEGPRP
ncbi:YbaK/prolyl-tRNA synthetase associated domain-containing protein [Streptomyces mexicanus]|uniref:YbaK/prolyl-tRNA synthetase associated domain-containing protein n=1 Tax=Streptomyces mexicanus TaxID=178566 RepID=A0A7X1HZT4_9ACTN|nr:YbaK/prolyl-tRNA synthetase associated domain-containing protein [Streptomyces mexicanus]